MKILYLTLAVFIFFTSDISAQELSPEEEKKSYVERAKQVNPVIFSMGRLVITQAIPLNSMEDQAKIVLPARIESGVDVFPSDLIIKDEIPQNEAVVFIFANKDRQQVIKTQNMLVTRDFVFLNKDGRVVEIRRSISSKNVGNIVTQKPVSMLMQLPEGDIKKYGIKLNDEVKLENDSPAIF